MKSRNKRVFINCYLALVFTITVILVSVLSKEGKGFASILAAIRLNWIFAALGCMAAYLFVESWAVHYITSFMYRKLRFFYIMKMNLIGNYYGALTPAGIGFQASQIAYMKRDGIPVGVSTLIQIIKMMTYEVVIMFICLAFMAAKGQFLIANYPEIFWLSIFGSIVNLFMLTIMGLAISKRDSLEKIVIRMMKFLMRIKIIKNIENIGATVEKTLDDYHDSAKYLKLHKARIAIACLLTLLQWLMFFTIPYCLYNAFSLGLLNGQPACLGATAAISEALNLIVMAAFLFMAVHFIPIPGASGAAEAAFGVFFGKVFLSYSAAAMFIWRLITYYSLIVIGFVIIMVDGLSKKNKNPNKWSSVNEDGSATGEG